MIYNAALWLPVFSVIIKVAFAPLAITIAPIFGSFIALALIATLINGGIVTLWWVFGYIAGSSGARQGARNEYYQLAGNIVIIVIVIAALTIFASLFVNLLNATVLLNQPSINAMCNNIASYNRLPIPLSGGSLNIPRLTVLGSGTNSLLTGPTTPPATGAYSEGLCNIVSSSGATSATPSFIPTTGTATTLIDYPLAATGVVIANLTNQTVVNLNDLYITDAMIGFLANLKIQLNLCIEAFLPCVSAKVGGLVIGTSLFEMGVSFIPLAGYSLIFSGLGIIGNLMVTSAELFISQLMLITVSLYIWPFLLFVGFVLRSTMFTRKLGGLFIALGIAAVMIYPAVFAFEYLALGNGFTSTTGTNPYVANAPNVYGFNSMLDTRMRSIIHT